MEPAGIIAMATAIATAIGVILKNKSQDDDLANLRLAVGQLKAKVADCEQERRMLMEHFISEREERKPD